MKGEKREKLLYPDDAIVVDQKIVSLFFFFLFLVERNGGQMALPSSKNISALFCDSLQLFFSGIIIIEAEHGYASSLPMPIEDDGSSPTPSSSSSSTRPIKIKKNQGSR